MNEPDRLLQPARNRGTTGPMRLSLLFAFLAVTLVACACGSDATAPKTETPETPAAPAAARKLEHTPMAEQPKTDAEWRKILTPEQYRILREKGTERPFTGEYWNTKDDGVYTCAGCGEVLYDAKTKFDSGCGWPSFYQEADPKVLKTAHDTSHGMQRTELMCARCGGHLGHVFDDGPAPTGQRHCINSASLKFVPR
jgi:peptide-methionine (R)-S-oxide reductase